MAILKYKGSDGNFKPLANILVKGIDVVQTSGTSSADVMSQNAVTEFVGDVNNTLTSHTSNTEIHVTAADKEKLHTHSNKASLDSITGDVGTMAYENVSSYSSATEVNTALGNKADKADAVVSAITVSSDLSNVTCPDSITGSSKSGAQAIVIYENGGTTTDYTITVSTNYKSPDGSQISITCAKGGYCEVSYINVNGTIYARGA